ncbi:MAG: hypothetical protein ABIP35_05955 [Ginsengibacter sp.]
MKQIDIKVANACVAKYKATMKKLGVSTPEEGLTTSVTFNSQELMKWLETVGPQMTELKVVFGVCTKELSPKKVGRFTVFLWPQNSSKKSLNKGGGDDPMLPVNLGDLLP